MRITFVYITIREGSLDILATALRPQIQETDWNLVIVDGFPGRVERGRAENCMLVQGLPLRAYVKPKPRTFPWSRTGFANAINTGALHADGDWVVYLHDYTIYPGDMVKVWKHVLSEQDSRTLVHGIGQNLTCGPPDDLDDVRTWKENPQLYFLSMWIPEVFELGYFALPMNFLEEINGLDERGDFCFTFPTRSVVAQARLLDYKLVIDHRLVCGLIDHHMWESEEEKYKAHQANRWRIPGEYSDVPEEPVWTSWSANPMNFKRERERINAQLSEPVRLKPRFHYLLDKMEIQ